MSIGVNGIAHIQMTVNNIEECMPSGKSCVISWK